MSDLLKMTISMEEIYRMKMNTGHIVARCLAVVSAVSAASLAAYAGASSQVSTGCPAVPEDRQVLDQTAVGTHRHLSPERLEISLGEMFSMADSLNKTIKVYEAAVDVADKELSAAGNALLPEINFSASASYNGNAWVSDRNFSGGQTFESPHFGNSFSVEASQVVFAGGAIHHNIKALEVQKSMAEWTLEEHRQQIYFLLAGYYLDLYKSLNLIDVYRKNMEQTRQVIRDMEERQAAGIVLDNDITRYEVQYQNLKYSLTEAQSYAGICNNRIVTMIGLSPQTEILPDTTLLDFNMPAPAEAELQDIACSSSPLLNRSRLNLEFLSRKEKEAKAGYLPKISIIAGDNLNGPITYEIPVLDNNINIWYVGVGLKFNVGNLYKTPREVSRLRSSRVRAGSELVMSEENVSMDVKDAYVRYLDSFELLRTQEKSLELAQENYQVIADRYANDLVLVTDLVDADNLRLAAEVQYVNARINIIYNYCRLLYTAGILDSVR